MDNYSPLFSHELFEFNDIPRKRRKRTIIPAEHLLKLEKLYKRVQWPSREQKEELAHEIGMSTHFVNIWFQNKRSRMRKLVQEEDEVASIKYEPSGASAGEDSNVNLHNFKPGVKKIMTTPVTGQLPGVICAPDSVVETNGRKSSSFFQNWIYQPGQISTPTQNQGDIESLRQHNLRKRGLDNCRASGKGPIKLQLHGTPSVGNKTTGYLHIPNELQESNLHSKHSSGKQIKANKTKTKSKSSPISFLRCLILMMALTDCPGSIPPGSREFDLAVAACLYGVKIADGSFLGYNENAGFHVEGQVQKIKKRKDRRKKKRKRRSRSDKRA